MSEPIPVDPQQPGPGDTPRGYRFLDHTADVWVQAWGKNSSEAVAECVFSLMDTMIDEGEISLKEFRNVSFTDSTLGSALVGFLSEFLFLFDTEGWLVSEIPIISVELGANRKWTISAETRGECFNSEKHIPDTEIKAITYSYLLMKQYSEYYEIRVIFDI